MGCIGSTVKFVIDTDFPGQDYLAQEIFDNLRLTSKEIDKLFTVFRWLDKDLSGSINSKEMMSKFGLRGSSLDLKLFQFFDEDGSGELNFMEFVMSMWFFLSIAEDSIAEVAFLIKDPTAKKSLGVDAIVELLEMVHQKKMQNSPVVNEAIASLSDSESFTGVMNIVEFKNWTIKYPSLVNPLRVLQAAYRKAVVSISFWTTIRDRRQTDEEEKQHNNKSSNSSASSATFLKKLQRNIAQTNKDAVNRKALAKAKDAIRTRRGHAEGEVSTSTSSRRRKPSVSVMPAHEGEGDIQKEANVKATPKSKQTSLKTGDDMLSSSVETTVPSRKQSSAKIKRPSSASSKGIIVAASAAATAGSRSRRRPSSALATVQRERSTRKLEAEEGSGFDGKPSRRRSSSKIQ